MKKNYELLQVNVISLGNEDVITASSATRGFAEELLGGGIGVGTQTFTY